MICVGNSQSFARRVEVLMGYCSIDVAALLDRLWLVHRHWLCPGPFRCRSRLDLRIVNARDFCFEDDTYQDLARPEIVTKDEQKALMVVRPNYLTLIDLPEDSFLLTEAASLESLVLPGLSIPILIGVQVGGILLLHSSEVDKRTVLSVTVCVDITSGPQSADITIPWFCLSIPPEFAESFGLRDRMSARCIDRDLSNSSAKQMVFEVGSMVQQEVQDASQVSVPRDRVEWDDLPLP